GHATTKVHGLLGSGPDRRPDVSPGGRVAAHGAQRMIIAPVRLQDRWIDDSSPIELWSDDRSVGLRLAISATRETDPSLAIVDIQQITRNQHQGVQTSVIIDLSSGEIRDQDKVVRVLGPPLDLAWLRDKLDNE